MSYKPKREKHGMSFSLPLSRYATCAVGGCRRVRRAWGQKPLIHNGGKP